MTTLLRAAVASLSPTRREGRAGAGGTGSGSPERSMLGGAGKLFVVLLLIGCSTLTPAPVRHPFRACLELPGRTPMMTRHFAGVVLAWRPAPSNETEYRFVKDVEPAATYRVVCARCINRFCPLVLGGGQPRLLDAHDFSDRGHVTVVRTAQLWIARLGHLHGGNASTPGGGNAGRLSASFCAVFFLVPFSLLAVW